MSKFSKEDIIRMVREGDVEFIRMQFTDIFGQLKNVAITASQIEKAVNNQIMIDGSSIEGFVRIHESDQYLRPDLDSYAVLPWRPQTGKVARLIESGNIYASCIQAANEALSGVTNVGSATHFRRAGGRDGIVIGNHVFW